MSVSLICKIGREVQREAFMSAAFLGLLVLGCVAILISSVYGAVTIGDRFAVVESIGFSAASIASILFILWFGLTRLPVSRIGAFAPAARTAARGSVDQVLGTFLGTASAASLLSGVLCLFLLCYLKAIGAGWHTEVIEGALYMALESWVITGGMTLFSSLLVTPVVIGVSGLAMFLIGRSSSAVLLLGALGNGQDGTRAVINTIYSVLPHLDSLAVYDRLIFDRAPGVTYFLWSVLYAGSYVILELLPAVWISLRRPARA